MNKYSNDYKYELLQRMMPPNKESVREASQKTNDRRSLDDRDY